MSCLKRKTISLFLIFSLLVGIVGIANMDTAYAASKKIHVKKKTVSMSVGSTYTQKLIGKNGKAIKATKVKWKSKNTAVAKISKKGKITAVKAGTAKMTAKYKGKTYKFTVKVSASAQNVSTIRKIYNYVYSNGYSVDSSYYVSGNRCIETASGSDVFIISIKTDDPTKVYFASFRTKPEPTKYADTTETTMLTYDMNNPASGKVEFFQVYYTGTSVSSWGHYTSQGVMNYGSYTGGSYISEQGITDITKGDNRTPVSTGSYDSKPLIDGAQLMTGGVDRLLSKAMNLRLRNIGFSKL